jgi:hypothetical protein
MGVAGLSSSVDVGIGKILVGRDVGIDGVVAVGLAQALNTLSKSNHPNVFLIKSLLLTLDRD